MTQPAQRRWLRKYTLAVEIENTVLLEDVQAKW